MTVLSDKTLLEIWHSNQCTSDDLPLLRAVADAAIAADRALPEGWMRDEEEVRKLQYHLESIGWQPDEDGNPVCTDQAAAMSADVIRLVLLPLLAAQKEPKK